MTKMARVLITEQLAQPGIELLRSKGHDVQISLDLSPDELSAEIAEADALIVRSATQVDKRLLDEANRLQVIGRAGVGLDNVDIATATSRGILVCNAPESNVVSAAEHSVALLLALARNVAQAHSALIQGRWERSLWTGAELLNKTVGIVGLGRVGRLVAQRLKGLTSEFSHLTLSLVPSQLGQSTSKCLSSMTCSVSLISSRFTYPEPLRLLAFSTLQGL